MSRQYARDPDQTYVAAEVLHWTCVIPFHAHINMSLVNRDAYSVLEINVGLICACAAVFPAFFDKTAPRSLGSLVGSLLARRSQS